MKFTPLPLAGAFLIDLEKKEDPRGFFARVFCRKEYEAHGLDPDIAQINTSLSLKRGTLRGLHYQVFPKAETKVIRCLRGALWDVIVDLRPESKTYLCHYGCELNEENRRMVYVPRGFAHGFLTLADNTEAFYLVGEFYSPEHERGIRYNDPALNISWPFEPLVISEKDRNYPDWNKEKAVE
ncbi:dTDP-4-dehydrorhamnose 3,5-epimerase [Candidatus Methylacidiphilum infernorum]|uniref:dTDP-4-dehydrorhamnose 3,5-epimerase n=1 Tax=Candidatus Methylacidiphilum infernorum TaxID=511746 RepID=A0ABX7PTQ8_9BACT|nr:dTDP-4-dehydrorhamnose 3,5-epimerase [Candidatus Methylacidiphilum infernorum]QSR86376.1 dTDP-4-dehydrorhamnose 3,5-epimerase [Candidatus Methylacidiphilum infernorum]